MPKYYPKPEYSRMDVNKAGEILINANSDQEYDWALAVINNWRTSHNFPLNTFQRRLRDVAKKINPESLIAQRIKRFASIKLKLELQPNMKMSQMQDLGGCRAILKDIQ
jgi:(p)ppGpp synthase/HD superfamily hydrolase